MPETENVRVATELPAVYGDAVRVGGSRERYCRRDQRNDGCSADDNDGFICKVKRTKVVSPVFSTRQCLTRCVAV